MPDYKVLGGTDPATNPLGILTEGIGFPLRVVDESTAGGNVTITTEDLLLGDSEVDQEVVAGDTPFQVEFGAAQPGAVVSLDVAGAVTFHEADEFTVRILLIFGRVGGGGGNSLLFGRVLLNGTQIGASLGTIVDDTQDVQSEIFADSVSAEINDILTVEVYSDEAGTFNGTGGLLHLDSSLGWNPSPSAEIHIVRAVAVAT